MASDSASPAASQSGGDRGISQLIAQARGGAEAEIGALLETYRNYMTVLASTQLQRRLRPRISPSDVVQETMLRAHANFGQFRGGTEAELTAWLRQILVNNLAKFVERHLLAARRDIRREAPIDQLQRSLEQSTLQLAALVPANQNSPSVCAVQREEAVILADRLASLPPAYQQVLLLRNLQGLPFEKVAARLDRTESATRMLWLRAIKKLREVYYQDDHGE